MAIKTLLFDLGGVLIHLNREESVRRFVKLGVHDAAEMLDPYLQNGIFLQLENGTLDKEAFRQAISLRAGKAISHDEIMWGLLGFLEEVAAYKFDYIEQLRSRYKIYIISNTNPYIMEFAESPDFLPNHRPLSSYVDGIFASCNLKMVKPFPEIFEYMPHAAHFLPEEALFIDDGKANVETAARMGYKTYCPPNYYDWRADLERLLTEVQ